MLHRRALNILKLMKGSVGTEADDCSSKQESIYGQF